LLAGDTAVLTATQSHDVNQSHTLLAVVIVTRDQSECCLFHCTNIDTVSNEMVHCHRRASGYAWYSKTVYHPRLQCFSQHVNKTTLLSWTCGLSWQRDVTCKLLGNGKQTAWQPTTNGQRFKMQQNGACRHEVGTSGHWPIADTVIGVAR